MIREVFSLAVLFPFVSSVDSSGVYVGFLDGSYLNVFFCIQSMMLSSFRLRPLQFS